MTIELVLAGSLGIVGAGIHGIAGELLVIRELAPATLPPSRFGGPATTRRMIHVTWHLTTVAFLAVGIALVLSGTVLTGEAARGVGLLAAASATGFAALTVTLAAAGARSPLSLLRHPGPGLLTATAALAWSGLL